MDKEGSVGQELKTWGFRQSTIARREFMEAVSSVKIRPPTTRRGGRQLKGRGRGHGRGRGKQASKTSGTPAAPKWARGAQRRVPESVLNPADFNEDEAQDRSDMKSVGQEIVSDRAEDSDDLTLTEIRKRAMTRHLEEFRHSDGDDGVREPKDTAEGAQPLVDQEIVSMAGDTDVSSGGGIVLSALARWASGNSVAFTTAQKASGGRTVAKIAKKTSKLADEESSEKMDRDVLCYVCQQTHNNRLMICCDSCRKYSHFDCMGISEAHGCLLQKNEEQFICCRCSEDHNTTRKTRSTLHVEETVEPNVKLQETEEVTAAFPKCIGPGCTNNPLPESVYCGHQCIIQHAAAAMKCLSKIENKPASPPLKSQKRSFLAKLFKVKISESPVAEKRVKADDMSEGSLCCAEVRNPQRLPATAAVEDKDIIKDKEVKCNTNTQTLDNSSSEKTPVLPLIKKSTPGKARKTMPGSPRLEILRGALSKSQGKSKLTSESRKPPDVGPTLANHAMIPPPSPLQIRQNIRRSLTEVLLQRINDIGHMDTTGQDVEKLAVNMEKDIFNMCYTTDEVYQNKYQQLVLNLKDFKNKVLCHQLLKGEISSINLLNLSIQEVKSVEDSSGEPEPQNFLKEGLSPHLLQVAKAIPACQETLLSVKRTSVTTRSVTEKKLSLSQPKQTQGKKLNPDVQDMISNMLKDTTLQHKRHLFDLNCRICTGQVSTNGDPETKKLKMEKTSGNTQEKSWLGHVKHEMPVPARTDDDFDIMESPASPSAEECEMKTSPVDFSPVLIPAVPTVSISRKDPRTSQFRQVLISGTDPKFVSLQSKLPPPAHNVKEALKESPHIAIPMSMPKSILMKPSPSPASRLDPSYCSTTRLMESDNRTRQFLSKQETLWKGFLNMPTVAKFVTKGYLISGCPDSLKVVELYKSQHGDLPDTIQIGGRILPQTVWEYVELIKTSEAKEMSLICFHPASEEEEVAYVSLFSYFNSRRRFGVVSNICKHIKDLYLIPLCAKESIPAVLLPIEGSGLEQNHPNLLIGLVICQKPKRPEAFIQEVGEKKSSLPHRSDIKDAANNSTSLKTPEDDQHNTKACDPEILNKTNDSPLFGFPDPSYFSRSSPGSFPISSALSMPKFIMFDSAITSRDSSSSTPLQTILNTLFGQRKQKSDVTACETSTSTEKVQQFLQTDKETGNAMELCDDRPYDPEEYDPAVADTAMILINPASTLECNSPTIAADDDDRPYDPEEEYNAVDTIAAKNTAGKASQNQNIEEIFTVKGDQAYDPEDETVFEEMQNYLSSNVKNHSFTICEQDNISNATLSEQQKILEELNRQIEEQKRQLEEQTETLRLQKEAIGVSMAHFSVSHALMSPPPQFGRDKEEEVEKLSYPINTIRDLWTCQQTSMYGEDASKTVNKENKTQIIFNMNNMTAVVDTSSVSNKEKLDFNKMVPKEGSPDTETVQLQNTTSSLSEYCSKTKDSRRSYTSSRRRTWHEHRSYHKDRASSRASHKTKVLKNVSDKHDRSRQSAGQLFRERNSDRKRLTSSGKRQHHHHRDLSSRYRRRDYSTGSHSSWRNRSLQNDSDTLQKDSDMLHKTDQQQARPAIKNAQSLQPDFEQGPGSNEMPCETATYRDKQLAEVQQGDYITTKPQVDKSNQIPHTSQNHGEDSQNHNAFDRNQPFSGHSEMKRNNLLLSKIDHSSKQRPLLPSPYMPSSNTAHGNTDQPFNNSTPAIQPTQIQRDVFHQDSVSPYIEKEALSNQPPHKQTDPFSGSSHMDQERSLPSMQRQNSLHNEAHKILSSRDYPQRSFQSQCRDFTQSSDNLFNCSYMDAKFMNLKSPIFCHKKDRSYMKGQHFHRDESVPFQHGETLLGPPPVDKDSFRPLNPKKHFQPEALNPSCVDKCKPSKEFRSVMEMRRCGQPRDANTSTFAPYQTIGPGGPSSGPCQFEHEKTRPPLNSVEPMDPFNVGEPSEIQFDSSRDPQQSHCNSPKGHNSRRQFDNSDSHMPHLNNTRGCAPFEQFHESQSDYRCLSHKQPKETKSHAPPHDLQRDTEDSRTQTCLSIESQTYPQTPRRRVSHNLFEGRQYPEDKVRPRGHQQSGLRGYGGRNVGRCFVRCQNSCEIQNMWQPQTCFECPTGQLKLRPLRGPLLPTPLGGGIRPYIPRVQRPNLHSEYSRSQSPDAMRQGHVTNDIRGPWIHRERPSTGHSFNPQQTDDTKCLIQEEQRVKFDGRRGEQSVQNSSYRYPYKGTRGSRRAGKKLFGNIQTREGEYAK